MLRFYFTLTLGLFLAVGCAHETAAIDDRNEVTGDASTELPSGDGSATKVDAARDAGVEAADTSSTEDGGGPSDGADGATSADDGANDAPEEAAEAASSDAGSGIAVDETELIFSAFLGTKS